MFLEIFVNCVEGWEVIFNYVLVIFVMVKLMLGVFYCVMEYVVVVLWLVFFYVFNCNVINMVL